MSQWPSTRARQVLKALERIGWTIKRTTGSHRVLSRDDILRLAPAESAEAADRAVDHRVARLRSKLATEAIRTVRGSGYVFVPPGS